MSSFNKRLFLAVAMIAIAVNGMAQEKTSAQEVYSTKIYTEQALIDYNKCDKPCQILGSAVSRLSPEQINAFISLPSDQLINLASTLAATSEFKPFLSNLPKTQTGQPDLNGAINTTQRYTWSYFFGLGSQTSPGGTGGLPSRNASLSLGTVGTDDPNESPVQVTEAAKPSEEPTPSTVTILGLTIDLGTSSNTDNETIVEEDDEDEDLDDNQYIKLGGDNDPIEGEADNGESRYIKSGTVRDYLLSERTFEGVTLPSPGENNGVPLPAPKGQGNPDALDAAVLAAFRAISGVLKPATPANNPYKIPSEVQRAIVSNQQRSVSDSLIKIAINPAEPVANRPLGSGPLIPDAASNQTKEKLIIPVLEGSGSQGIIRSDLQNSLRQERCDGTVGVKGCP